MQQPWNDYGQAVTILLTKKEKFTHLLQSVLPRDADLLINMKSHESFLSKLTRKPIGEIHDVLRAAILTNSNQEVFDITDRLKEISNVIECDYKDEPDGKTGYYGACHLKIQIDNVICEVQIMTKVLWSMKEILHNRYEMVRVGKPLDKSVKQFSRFMYDTANKSVE